MRALSFVCGVLLLFSAVFGFVMDLFSGQFSAFMISFWLILFSLLIIVTEAKVKAFENFAGPALRSYMQIFSTVEGRGVWLCLVGLLAMSLLSKGSWQNFLSFTSGLISVLVGLTSIVMGKIAARKARELREKLHDEENVRAEFKAADRDGNGTLDVEELGELCQKLGSQMGQNQLEMTLRTLDDDGNGGIDIDEFLKWFRGEESIGGGDEETGGVPVGKETPVEQMKEMKLKVSWRSERSAAAGRSGADCVVSSLCLLL